MILFLVVAEPVLSSNELDEVQYNISTPGSFAFAQRPNGSVSLKVSCNHAHLFESHSCKVAKSSLSHKGFCLMILNM